MDRISYRDYVNQLLNGNPYAYNISDVARYYLGNMGDRVQDWYKNWHMQQLLNNANRQQLQKPQQDYSWMEGLGY